MLEKIIFIKLINSAIMLSFPLRENEFIMKKNSILLFIKKKKSRLLMNQLQKYLTQFMLSGKYSQMKFGSLVFICMQSLRVDSI